MNLLKCNKIYQKFFHYRVWLSSISVDGGNGNGGGGGDHHYHNYHLQSSIIINRCLQSLLLPTYRYVHHSTSNLSNVTSTIATITIKDPLSSSSISSSSLSSGYKTFQFEVIPNERIGVIRFNRLTTLTAEFMDELCTLISSISSTKKIIDNGDQLQGLVLISGSATRFITGVDLHWLYTMLNDAKQAETLSRTAHERLFDALEHCPIPIVSAIVGHCIGGGTELALATHYRIAIADQRTSFSLPEVSLGLLPAGGGTNRLPALIPLFDAIKMLLTGEPVSAINAKRIGLVDALVELPDEPGISEYETLNHLEQVAIQMVKKISADKSMLIIKKKKPTTTLSYDEQLLRWLMRIDPIRTRVLNRILMKIDDDANSSGVSGGVGGCNHQIFSHPEAINRLIDVLHTVLKYGPKSPVAFHREATMFGELLMNSGTRSLIHLTLGCEQYRKRIQKQYVMNGDATTKKLKKIVIFGDGGNGNESCSLSTSIAKMTLNAGISTTICTDDNDNDASLQRAKREIFQHFNHQYIDGKLNRCEHDRIMALLRTTTTKTNATTITATPNTDDDDRYRFSNVDLILETTDDIKLRDKKQRNIQKLINNNTGCILATSTTAVSLEDILTNCCDSNLQSKSLIGLHYHLIPAHRTKLVEVIKMSNNADKANNNNNANIAKVIQFISRQRAIPLVVNDTPGFYTTRCYLATVSELLLMLQEGGGGDLTPQTLDQWMMKQLGTTIGGCTLLDLAGIDTVAGIAKYLRHRLPHRFGGGGGSDGGSDWRVLNKMLDLGFFGQQCGKGFFDYEKIDEKRVTNNHHHNNNNEKVLNILRNYHRPLQRKQSLEDRRMRLLTRTINEAMFCLQEGIIEKPIDGDIGAVYGCNFPPTLGGPFRFVDTYGATKVVDYMYRLCTLYDNDDDGGSGGGYKRFIPNQLLLDHAHDANKRFYKHL